MPLTHIRIENFKSIKRCDLDLCNLNALIGANGTGKTNILDALNYFYINLTEQHIQKDIFDLNNKFSNEVKITLTFDLSDFVKISKSHTDELSILFDDESEKDRYRSYYKAIISLAKTQKNNQFSINLIQTKEKGLQWSEKYEHRFIIKSLFPFFYVNSRDLDINEWTQIWGVLGELGKISNTQRSEIHNSIKDLIDKDQEISKKIKGIHEIFESSEVSIRRATSKDFATTLSKIYFEGNTIYQKGRSLRYYSTGTNSVKYIELLLKAINEIAKNKLKEPIVIFDEPEISLHPNYIDELAENFLEVDSRLRIMISTHSSRLIKNLMTSDDLCLYRISIKDKYSVVAKMRKYTQYSPASKYRVLDDHINSYFSKAILFVEGETELELFSNPYLHFLFPQIKKYDVYKAMSETPILNIMHPNKSHSEIPYVCLIDADKAIDFNTSTYKLTLKGEFFGETKEKFLFRNKKESEVYLSNLRKRIEKMAAGLHIHCFKPLYSSRDQNLTEFKAAVHQYLNRYNIFSFDTTIEGALINAQNFSFALNFLKSQNKESDFNAFQSYLLIHNSTDKINLLRLVYNGKTDLLKTYKSVRKDLASDAVILDRVSIGKKTSGWVSEYIDFYFASIIPDTYEKSPKGMLKYFDENENAKKQISRDFKYSFSELYSLFEKMCDII